MTGGTRPPRPLVIAGGGLSGSLAALALAQRRPEVAFLLVEQRASFGGNQIWSFFDDDIAPEDLPLVRPMVTRRWGDHEVVFPKRRRTLGLGYNSVKSGDLDRLMRSVLEPGQYALGRRIETLGPSEIVLDGGQRIEAAGVIDARGPAAGFDGLDLAWQKFAGRTYRFGEPHERTRPVIMDARVDQDEGYRFVYSLPFSETELMVEDTYYSASPTLDVPLLRGRIDSYVRRLGLAGGKVEAEETGVLPILLGGSLDALWPLAEQKLARLGLRGGFFHPTTGYSLPDAVANARLLAEQPEFGSERLHALFHARSATLWKQRRFYQSLNRMLFRAAAPRQRFKVLEHFYRLPEPLIARFYAGRLTAVDKARILSGRPPVPVGKALAAMWGKRP